MGLGKVFEDNATQAVSLTAETRFPESIKRVTVRVEGHERILAPIEKTWDSFFFGEHSVSDDFMDERHQPEFQYREDF